MGMGLEGLRVIEVGGGVAAPVAGKLMADLGATVIKVEPPEGETTRHRGPYPAGKASRETSGLHLALNPGKRSLALNLGTEEGQHALDGLVQQCDVLLHSHTAREMLALRLDYRRFARINPRLVMLSMTPFGLTGPYRDYEATDLTLIHASGWGWLCPGPGTEPALAPIKPYGQHAYIQAGLHGAVAAVAAYLGALSTGVGEHIDLSMQEVNASFPQRTLVSYSYQGKLISRLSPNLHAPSGFYACADGYVFLVIPEEDQWQRLLELMGNPAWASDPRFANREQRGSNERALNEHLDAWMATQKVEELFHACQQRRVCVTPVITHARLLEQPHLRERGFITEQRHPVAGTLPMPGAPYLLDKPWWRLRGPAPLLGEANGQPEKLLPPRPRVEAAEPQVQPKLPVELPLAGVRVLDLCWVWAGPYGTLQLAHLGAEVLKIESGARPDQSRRINIHPTGMAPGVNTSGYFNDLAQGKRSVAINLAHPEGIALVKRLAAESDVITSNFATGVMERLGLGVEALRAVKDDLIIASISGFGQSGPCKDYIGYGNAMIALSGITASTGYGDGRPREVGFPYADPVAGVHMAFAIVAALAAKRLHGGGQTIDLSLWEVAASIGFEGWINHALGHPPHAPMGNRDPWHAPHNLYRCAGEDAWVSIAVTSEAHWNALCQALGRIDWLKDERLHSPQGRKQREAELDAVIAPWCRGKDRWEVTRMLQAARVPAFPCMSAKDLVEDPHLGVRRYYTRLDHPVVGRREQIGIPWKLANRPNGVRTPAPLLGADTDAVLMSVLGISTRQVVRLWENKVLG